MAALYERWARQLRLSASILDRDAGPQPPPRLKRISLEKLRLN